jgi:serine/threonine protein kinase
VSERDPLIGTTVGSYEIREKIGMSRWGSVYKAFQHSMQRMVALKILSPEVAALPGKTDQFREDARAEVRILHPHIVAIYEAGYADGLHFWASEYMDGPPLVQFLRINGGVDEHRLLQTILGATRALKFLWNRQIPHQPPTSTNILTEDGGTAKLINILPADAPAAAAPQDDILALGVILGNIVNEIGPVSRPVGELVERMVGADARKPFATLGELTEAAEELDVQLFAPVKTAPLDLPRLEHKRTKPAIVEAIIAWLRRR